MSAERTSESNVRIHLPTSTSDVSMHVTPEIEKESFKFGHIFKWLFGNRDAGSEEEKINTVALEKIVTKAESGGERESAALAKAMIDLKTELQARQTEINELGNVPPELKGKVEKLQSRIQYLQSNINDIENVLRDRFQGEAPNIEAIRDVEAVLGTASNSLIKIVDDLKELKLQLQQQPYYKEKFGDDYEKYTGGSSVTGNSEHVVEISKKYWKDMEEQTTVGPQDHSELFTKDVERSRTVVDGKEIKKEGVEKVSDAVGNAILSSLCQSENVKGMSEDEQQRLRYEAETYCSQLLATPEFGTKLHSMNHDGKYMGKYGQSSVEEPPYGLTFTCNFHPETNTMTVSVVSYTCLRSLDDNSVVGYDAQRTTLTIDLNAVNGKDLLASPGAVSVKRDTSGFRRTLEEIRFEDAKKPVKMMDQVAQQLDGIINHDHLISRKEPARSIHQESINLAHNARGLLEGFTALQAEMNKMTSVPSELKEKMKAWESNFASLAFAIDDAVFRPDTERTAELNDKLKVQLSSAGGSLAEISSKLKDIKEAAKREAFNRVVQDFEPEWARAKDKLKGLSNEEMIKVHPKKFADDMRTDEITVDGTSIEKGDREKSEYTDEAGKAIFEKLREQFPNTEEFSDETLHLMRYEIECMFNQWLGTVNAYEHLDEHDKHGEVTVPTRQVNPQINIRDGKIYLSIEIPYDVYKKDDMSKPIGKEQSFVELEIDLKKIDPKKLLEADDCAMLGRENRAVSE